MRLLALLAVAALALPAAAATHNTTQRSVDLPDAVQVGHIQLKPGTYKVEWQNAGPNVQVSFLQGHKTVATVPATVKTNDSQVKRDDVVTTQASGNREILREIDFSHGKDAVILSKGA